MGSFPWRLAAALAVCLAFGGTAAAQEFRVYTEVRGYPGGDVRQEPTRLSRSLTLYHAGLVYDFVGAANEVTVFDPGNRRFIILNTARGLATTIDFVQLEKVIDRSRQETARYADDRGGSSAEALRFQLDPRFEERYDAAAERLVLEGRYMTYTVRCAAAPGPAEVRAILDYFDWAARLNHALQPQAFFPAARIALDESLRRTQRIPIDVDLQADFDAPLHLRAEHDFHWKLHATDRTLIHKWRRQLEDPKTKFVPFPEYQRTALAAKPSSRE
ncbi:MAG: hypothetical protein WD066_18795 [Planctomycetaceae bacterium]